MSGGDTEFTIDEIAQHNKEGDCWIIIDGGVYDASTFMSEHPGGSSLILDESGPGKDASDGFEDAEHSKAAKN